MMDVKSMKNAELIACAFGVSGQRAEEAVGMFFPNPGEHFAMDCENNLRERLKAALEIDRRMASIEVQDVQNPYLARSMIQRIIGAQEHESFWVMYLDSQLGVIATREMSIGTATQCSVYPREIVKMALSMNACAVMLAHNHPSGSDKPSQADIHLTQTIKAALSLVDVRVLDHFVVTRKTCLSMAEVGLV